VNDYVAHPGWIASAGAAAVLLFAANQGPLTQPRNVMFGNVSSAIIGCSCHIIFNDYVHIRWLSGAFAVSLSIVFMQLTKTLYPPGGATALIAVLGFTDIENLHYYYVLRPVLLGSAVLFAVAVITGNLQKNKKYPKFWW